MPARSQSKVLLLLGIAAALSPLLRAQAPPGPDAGEPEGPIHTLRVFMDLIQVPVLVLDSELDRMKPIDPSKFLVSLDSGPNFHPRRVRQQGDDPISLAILLDANGEPDVMPKIATAVSALAPGSLHANDHVSIYGLDCTLTRTLRDAPADPAILQSAIESSIAKWTERHKLKQPTPPCQRRVNLWDAMSLAVKDLSEYPGRRVLLVVTDGEDHGSVARADEVRSLAQFYGVAVFGYSAPDRSAGISRFGSSSANTPRSSRSGVIAPSVIVDGKLPVSPFDSICQSSGGMIMTVQDSSVAKQLAKFTTILRERYILEFTRPRNETPGQHGIQVTVSGRPSAFIRPAAVTILQPDAAAAANDPNVIPRDASDAPEMGKQRPPPR
jgi:hypothetical protein